MIKTEMREIVITTPRTIAAWCDVCGVAAAPRYPSQTDEVNWVDTWEFDKTTVARSVGWLRHGEGARKTTSYHVCPACWEKLAAWIEAQRGATATVEENEW